MKPLYALLIVFSLLLLSCSIDARKEPAAVEYWKMVMKDSPMPLAIYALIVPSREEPFSSSEDGESGASRFVRDFDVKPNVIIYHNHRNIKKHVTDSSMRTRIYPEMDVPKALGHGDGEALTYD